MAYPVIDGDIHTTDSDGALTNTKVKKDDLEGIQSLYSTTKA